LSTIDAGFRAPLAIELITAALKNNVDRNGTWVLR
jgi:hypothetical protein